ncbi:unnamed protein product [Linum trigynum]|uniref:CCHC-type domain-containing protein n=1 Tax=Linum trigynum TaxID=586398 RepID=A0AAV2CHA7_9ROSI
MVHPSATTIPLAGKPPDPPPPLQPQGISQPSEPSPETATATISYRNALTGQSSQQPSKGSTWTFVGEHDMIPGDFNGEPALNLSETFKERLCQPWKKTLVVRLLGRSVSYAYLCSQLRWKWRPSGALDIIDLNNETFLVTCSNDQDYLTTLSGGPWVILDHYLLVHPWSPDFRVSDKPHRSVVAWVQFPELPVHFYHREVLFAIGNLIGRTIKLDYHTENLQRGKFARMAIDLDMTKPLPTRIHLDGKWQGITYENLPHICYGCGKIGHIEEKCPANENHMETALAIVPGNDSNAYQVPPPSDVPAGYGPWMQVTRKTRKVTKAKSGNHQINSSAIGADSGRSAPKSSSKGKSDLEMKGKKESKEGQRKEVSSLQKGKSTLIDASVPNGKKKGAAAQEWRVVGSSAMDLNLAQPMEALSKDKAQNTASTSTSITAKALQGPNNTKIQIISVPSLVDSTKENQNPNSCGRPSRQRSQKKQPTKALNTIQNRGISIKSPKKPLQLSSISRDNAKRAKDGVFPFTIKDIEEFCAHSNSKISEFQKLVAERSSEVSMEEDLHATQSETPADAVDTQGNLAAFNQGGSAATTTNLA